VVDMRSRFQLSSARLLALLALVIAAASCDKAPLLAPTNSSITLSASTRVLPIGGQTEITAFVIESAGTPVQNGTTVTFITNLGTLSPVATQTHNGMATTTFLAGDVSGVAEIKAISGAAGAGGTTTPPTTPGAPAATPTTSTSANVVQITVGAAAVQSVTVRANPATVSQNGGTVDIVATVLAAGGRTLSGVTVTFSADRGTLSNSTAVTDANGEARVQLTTNADTTVTVNAGAGTSTGTGTPPTTGTATNTVKITALTAPSVTLTCASGTSNNCSTLNVGDVAVFTAARAASGTGTGTGTTTNIRSATLDFGDGTIVDLGNLSGPVGASHQFLLGGTYTVRLTATDVNGEVSISTLIVIVQEPAIAFLGLSNRGNRHIDATTTVLGCTARSFDWNFGNNAVVQTLSTTNNQASADYTAGGTKTVTVIVRCVDGRTTNTSSQLTLDVNP
jgi:hypothetical protein